jgi:hypothetical protein
MSKQVAKAAIEEVDRQECLRIRTASAMGMSSVFDNLCRKASRTSHP